MHSVHYNAHPYGQTTGALQPGNTTRCGDLLNIKSMPPASCLSEKLLQAVLELWSSGRCVGPGLPSPPLELAVVSAGLVTLVRSAQPGTVVSVVCMG